MLNVSSACAPASATSGSAFVLILITVPIWGQGLLIIPTRRAPRVAIAASRGGDLALVMTAELGVSVRSLGRRVEGHERELRDRQSGPKLDRYAGEVVQLERQRPVPARVAKAGSRMNDQAEAPERGLSFDPRHDVVGKCDRLERRSEAELAGMDHERLIGADRVRLGQVARRLPQVDRRGAVVVEDAEAVTEAQVYARRLDE